MERIEKSDAVAPGFESEIRCDICGNMYVTSRALQMHFRLRHSEMLCVVCPVCGERFQSVRELQNHKKIHRRLYTCDLCPYTSYDARCLRVHVLKHSEETTYNCLVCKQPFRRRVDLTMHMNRVDICMLSSLFE